MTKTFNAATAVTPWRTAVPAEPWRSMAALQCGHGSDAVENPPVNGDDPADADSLQCGHGSDAVENNEEGFGYSKDVFPSMRPRQ